VFAKISSTKSLHYTKSNKIVLKTAAYKVSPNPLKVLICIFIQLKPCKSVSGVKAEFFPSVQSFKKHLFSSALVLEHCLWLSCSFVPCVTN